MFYKLLFICSVFIAFGVNGDQGSSFNGDQGSLLNGYQGSSFNGNQGSSFNGNQGSSLDGNQGSSINGNQGSSPNGNQGSSPNGDQSSSLNGGQSNTPSVDVDQSSTPSVDVGDISALSWNYGLQQALIQSSFYRNLDPMNQRELLAIVTNKQSSLDDMNTEIEEWYQKQPPQIQTAFKLYSQNLSQAMKEIKANSKQMQTNLSPAAKTFLQQEYEKDNTKNPEQIIEEGDQRFQALSPDTKQEIRQYDAQELQFDQQTFSKYLYNRAKRYIHF